jgi:aminopeptidase N
MFPAKTARRALLLVALALAGDAAAATRARVVLPDDVVPAAYRIELAPDAQAGRFTASVEIDLQVRRATRRIVLNAADLAIDAVTVDGAAKAPAVRLDERRETASFLLDHALAPGAHTLRIAYHGKVFDEPQALFRLRYATPEGERTALFTQFEDTDARRFVPCWDEPAAKATFELAATVPAALMAVGNMPVAATEELPGGLKRVRFAPTPRMSSYLLFFGLGDFERVHRAVDGIDVGVIVKRGDTASAGYALDAAAAILPYYDDWFGVKYPLPKMDMIAGAGASLGFGAMENWGALFYFEHDLLVDPRLSTEADRQRVFAVVAHEMAHQWFGDLVTMAWWDDLWLNEGFATWMESKAAERVHPEWRPWLQTLPDRQASMGNDARTGTHPLVMDIPDVTNTGGAFDSITYGKGAQVIRTLEATMGDDAFRDGMRRYMREHAFGNAVTDDLWAALDAGAATPIGPVARDLTRQPGVPLVEERGADCIAGRTHVRLAQSQFATDRDPQGPRRWHLPVRLATLGGGSAQAVITGAATQEVTVDGCGPLVINAGQTAYFRTRYTAAGLAALTEAFARLPSDDQLGLLGDTEALALDGRLPMGALLDLLARLPATADPVVAQTLVDQLADLDRLHDGLASQPAFRAWARAVLAPFMARVGWQARPGEDGNEALLRADLVETLGTFGDAEVVAQIDARFARFVADPASLETPLRHAVLRVAAIRADDATWSTLHALARDSKTFLEGEELYELLTIAREPALVARALELAASGEPPVTTVATMLRAGARRRPAQVLDFLSAHWDRLGPVLGPGTEREVVRRFFVQGDDLRLVAMIDAFAQRHASSMSRASLDKAEAVVRYRAAVRAKRLPEGDEWVLAQRETARRVRVD